jgi:hypothetical protein
MDELFTNITSFVERVNLTIRQCVSKLTPHKSLRCKLETPIQRKGQQRPRQYRKVSPAVSAISVCCTLLVCRFDAAQVKHGIAGQPVFYHVV